MTTGWLIAASGERLARPPRAYRLAADPLKRNADLAALLPRDAAKPPHLFRSTECQAEKGWQSHRAFDLKPSAAI